MSGVSKPLRMALSATLLLGGGSFFMGGSDDAEPVSGPAFPLSFVDVDDQVTPTTWQAPPVTRDPFVGVEVVEVGDVPTSDSPPGEAGINEVGPTTMPDRVTTTIDQRSFDDVVESRLPSTTLPPTTLPTATSTIP